jgi:hypothetical protein
MMNNEELNELLEKYYNGESTEEEEDRLRIFFLHGDVPPGYEPEKEIFSYYSEALEVPEPAENFEVRLLEGIDAYEDSKKHRTLRRIIAPVVSIAAVAAIFIGSYFFFTDRSQSHDTYSDPKIAYAETMKILRNVSSQLNSGARALEPVSMMSDVATKSLESINRSTRIVTENLKPLDYLQKAIDIANPYEDKINNK